MRTGSMWSRRYGRTLLTSHSSGTIAGRKKQLRKRRAETDEKFIEEMFSEVGMEQDHDGFHVV